MGSGDLTDADWKLIGPLLPPERGRPGRPDYENRPILDGILRPAIPERYGKWNSIWRRSAH